MNGRLILVTYFKNLEQSLISLSQAAKMPKGDETDTGQNKETLVSGFLETHLPGLAQVITGGVIIDSNTDLESTQQADVVVKNRFSSAPRFFAGGHTLAEGVYLALEVKSSIDQLYRALEQCASIKKLTKLLRPETTYFGFLSPPGERPDPSPRTSSPTAGIWIWPGNSKTLTMKRLDEVIERFGKNIRDDQAFRTMLPNVVFVPGNFLAFKIYPRIRNKPNSSTKSEYWYCQKDGRVHRKNGDFPVFYTSYEPGRNGAAPCRLHVFTLWLSQELLKFVHEVPDLFTYAFPRLKLSGRQGYSLTSHAIQVLSYKEGAWQKRNLVRSRAKRAR